MCGRSANERYCRRKVHVAAEMSQRSGPRRQKEDAHKDETDRGGNGHPQRALRGGTSPQCWCSQLQSSVCTARPAKPAIVCVIAKHGKCRNH